MFKLMSLEDVLANRIQVGQLFARKTVRDSNGCLIWTGATHKDGYGTFRVGPLTYITHRAAWALANNRDPGQILVLHSCDVPPCLEATHLFLGTHQDNKNDSVSKGRHSNGPHSIHPAATIQECIALRHQGLTYRQIGERLNISAPTAWHYAQGRRSYA